LSYLLAARGADSGLVGLRTARNWAGVLFNTSKMVAVAAIYNGKIFLRDEILMRIQSAALVS
jgi:hypothetical protein